MRDGGRSRGVHRRLAGRVDTGTRWPPTVVKRPLAPYLLSLPERVLRSVTAIAAGLVREIGNVTFPQAIRRTHLYVVLVENTLRFLIEQVGQVEGAYPEEGKLVENFALRRAAGDGIEFAGILAFHASPVWVLAALADLSGAGRALIPEIAEALKAEGLLRDDAQFESVNQVLDGLERSAGKLAATLKMPPLDVASLREEWLTVKREAAAIPLPNLPNAEMLRRNWNALQESAASQGRSVFTISSLLALWALRNVPQNMLWLSRCARSAGRRTGKVMAATLLDHYAAALVDMRQTGYLKFWIREFRPYLLGAAGQFYRGKESWTERVLGRKGNQNPTG
jgi:hypothetical protein